MWKLQATPRTGLLRRTGEFEEFESISPVRRRNPVLGLSSKVFKPLQVAFISVHTPSSSISCVMIDDVVICDDTALSAVWYGPEPSATFNSPNCR